MTPIAKRKLTLVCTALALCLSTTSAALAGCSDPAGPKVYWYGCLNLSGTELSNANLRGADLEYANLEGADLTEANMTYAYWTGGRKCAEGSIGECK
jgi:uncharacterized protein YjbI with pentapeptide repeats